MIDRLISWFAPHICEGCGATGSALCNRCNKNIKAKSWHYCLHCMTPISQSLYQKHGSLCTHCRRHLPFDRAFVVGKRAEVLRRLVGNFKYFSRQDYASTIARLLSTALPDNIPSDLQIVFVPTAPKHIRERGFDHMQLIARRLAKRRGLALTTIIQRLGNQVQHDASRAERKRQVRSAFAVKRRPAPERVLLIDDIYTTGATAQAIAAMLRRAGTREIWLAIVARHSSR